MTAATRHRRRERGLLDSELRCSRCDGPNPRPSQRYCATCHATYMRDWRKDRVYVKRNVAHETFSSTPQAATLTPKA